MQLPLLLTILPVAVMSQSNSPGSYESFRSPTSSVRLVRLIRLVRPRLLLRSRAHPSRPQRQTIQKIPHPRHLRAPVLKKSAKGKKREQERSKKRKKRRRRKKRKKILETRPIHLKKKVSIPLQPQLPLALASLKKKNSFMLGNFLNNLNSLPGKISLPLKPETALAVEVTGGIG